MAIIVSNRLLNELASKKMRFSEIYCFPLLPSPMNLVNCKKAVVSGSASKDVETLLQKSLGRVNLFDVLITADDIEKGKPDPSSFIGALDKINIPASQALVVENAPLGIEAANKAGIQCIVVLNNSPLNIQDFRSVISEGRIFKETISAARFIES